MYKALIALCLLGTACTSADSSNVDSPGKDDLIGNSAENEPCSYDWQCRADDDLVCRPSTYFVTSPDARCLPRSSPGGICASDDDCVAEHGIVCRPDGSYPSYPVYLCQELAARGGACESDDDCLAGMACHGAEWGSSLLRWSGSCYVP